MKKVMVTGASGFVGKALLRELSRRQIETIAVIREKSDRYKDIKEIPYVKIVYCDLAELFLLKDRMQGEDIDTCIHLGWTGSTGTARADYITQLDNVKYSMELVDVIGEMGVKRFVGAGTLAEKDVLNYHMRDGAEPNAVSIYGAAKVAAHLMTKAECNKRQVEHIWCFLANTYGEENETENFINFACKKMIMGERASFTTGEQPYDFVYVADTAKAICAAADKGKTNCSYYLGSGKPRKLKEYISMMRDEINPQIPLYLGEIEYNGEPLNWDEYSIEKLISDTGYFPETEFEEGIKLTINWLKREMDVVGRKDNDAAI